MAKLAAVLGGTQSLHTNSRDEALCLPTQDSVQIALRTQQIIAHESGVADTIDPLAGSYAVEALTDQIEAKADQIVEAASETTRPPGTLGKRLRLPIMLAFFIAFFNQLSGINAILYFAPRIFEWTGLGQQAALLNSVGIGITNLIFTYVCLWLIDRLGRRQGRQQVDPGARRVEGQRRRQVPALL